jgi:hypothetical protein
MFFRSLKKKSILIIILAFAQFRPEGSFVFKHKQAKQTNIILVLGGSHTS